VEHVEHEEVDALLEDFEANTENIFFTFFDLHSGHSMLISVDEKTSFSNFFPQLLQIYSKIGIFYPPYLRNVAISLFSFSNRFIPSSMFLTKISAF